MPRHFEWSGLSAALEPLFESAIVSTRVAGYERLLQELRAGRPLPIHWYACCEAVRAGYKFPEYLGSKILLEA